MAITAVWHWPQWTLLIMMTISLIGNCSLHRKERPPYNAPLAMVGFMISLFILSCGGFFG